MAILGVSLTSTLVVYGLFSSSNQAQNSKPEVSKINSLKVNKGDEEDKKIEEESNDEKKSEAQKASENLPGDKGAINPSKGSKYDFEYLMPKDDKIKIFKIKEKKPNSKIKNRKIKTKFSNKFKNILNSQNRNVSIPALKPLNFSQNESEKYEICESIDQEETEKTEELVKVLNSNNENISIPVSKPLAFSQNEKDEIGESINQEEAEKIKELKKFLERIKNFVPNYGLVGDKIADLGFKKRGWLIKKAEQFLNHDLNNCPNGNLICEELLDEIKELSKEISMYYEMREYKKRLDEITESIQQYSKRFRDQFNKFLPSKAAQLNERVCAAKNDRCMSEIFSKIKNNILDLTIVSCEDKNSCSNLEKSKLVKDFQKNMKKFEEDHSNCKKQLDKFIKKLQSLPDMEAPKPAENENKYQVKEISISKVTKK